MGCSHNCDSCSSNCGGEKSLKVAANKAATVRKVIGVVSGKGGVGKSLLTSMMAVGMTRKGYTCGVLDADITGPSIPKTFGVHDKLEGCEEGIIPARSEGGVQMISINLVLPNEDDPVIYRGPIIAETVKQFWSDVVWEDVDFLFVDMPPGTGDVPLTVFQSLPVDGIIVVTSPQDLVSMIVGNEHSGARHRRELQLSGVPGLRQAYFRLWREPCRRGRGALRAAGSGQAADRSEAC